MKRQAVLDAKEKMKEEIAKEIDEHRDETYELYGVKYEVK